MSDSGSWDEIRLSVTNILTGFGSQVLGRRLPFKALPEKGFPAEQPVPPEEIKKRAIQALRNEPRIKVLNVAPSLTEDGSLASIAVAYSQDDAPGEQTVTVSYALF